MSNKTTVDFPLLVELSSLAIDNETRTAFIPLALQWAEAANAEVERLRSILDRIVTGTPCEVCIRLGDGDLAAAKEYLEGK